MTETTKKTEWIETVGEIGQVQHVEVSSEWLFNTLSTWAKQDAEQVETNKEAYIKGRTEHLYEHLADKDFARSVYEIAVQQKAVKSVR